MADVQRATEISSKLTVEGERVLAYFGSFLPADWAARCHGDSDVCWTVRDVLEHFILSEAGLLRMFKSIAVGTGQGLPDDFDIERFNHGNLHKLSAKSTEELLEQFRAQRAQTAAFAATLSDAQLERQGRHPAVGYASMESMLRLVALHNTMHIKDVKHTVGR